MKLRLRKRTGLLVVGAAAVAVAATGAIAGSFGSSDLTGVSDANPKMSGFNEPNILSPELQEVIWAQGSMPLDGATAGFPSYGYNGNGPQIPAFVAAGPASNVEATKTEPDKNTYLVLRTGVGGPTSGYDYGTHVVFQGHENGAPVAFSAPYVPAGTTVKGSSITRINLDGDGAHRVTLFATQTDTGAPLAQIDGSNWDPFAQKLLFTTETAFATPPSTTPATPAPPGPSIYQATADYPSHVKDISNVIGRAGFEGVQEDSQGNLYLVEDVGGANGTGANARTKQPNSFLYRFKPKDPSDLTEGGQLQVLQVTVAGSPLKFTQPASSSAADVAAAANTDISGANSAGYVSLHQSGSSFTTKWIDIGSPTSSATPLPGADDNALAKAAGGTPFKRPENLAFRPGSKFSELYFDETGDTDNRTCAGGGPAPNPNLPACTSPNVTGGFTTIFKLIQSPKSDTGTISDFYNGDQAHAGFDNVTFFSKNDIAFVEDAGDTLHTQRDALDSAYLFDVSQDYTQGAQPLRFIAEGRDPSATIDSALSGSSGFQNDGDNEITGMFASDGDTSTNGLLGTNSPKLFQGNGQWRVFWTQQHGDNPTYELIPAPNGGNDQQGGDGGSDD